jgi:hypothetical protein
MCQGVSTAIGLQAAGTVRAHWQSQAIEGGGETSRPFVHEDPFRRARQPPGWAHQDHRQTHTDKTFSD